MHLTYILLLSGLLFLNQVLAANILYIATMLSPSHHIWNRALAYGLLEKGHKVTMFGHDEETIVPENYSQIIIEDIYEKQPKGAKNKQDQNYVGFLNRIDMMYNWAYGLCKMDLQTNGAKILLDNVKNNQYDLVIYESTTSHCFYPILDIVDKPTVAVTPFLLPPSLSTAFGNQVFTSHVPYFGTLLSNRMNFFERTQNFINTYMDMLYEEYIFIPKEFELQKQFFGEDIRPSSEIQRRFALLLSNIDHVSNYPINLPPNIISVGALQAKPPKPLPKDLQTILDEATNGVILFSLGSNLRSDSLDDIKKAALLGAFSRFSETILWKYESELDELPTNVIIRKWLPQNDILGHPNIKLFVTHGGALSTQEAMYHGVPIVGIPFFADQFGNVCNMVERKVAVHLSADELQAEKVYNAMSEGLKPEYRINMQTMSRIYRDQPQTSLERGVFWIEHVLRNGGGEHLTPVSRDMPWYQTHSLDVLALLSFTVCTAVFVFYKVMSLIICSLGTKQKEKML